MRKPSASPRQRDAAAARQSYIDQLDLRRLSIGFVAGGPTVERYTWPKANNGSTHDREILLLILPDGSWFDFLDTGTNNTAESVKRMRQMVQAPEVMTLLEQMQLADEPAVAS